jgi:DNA-binding transcriptional ArsR family regulator
MNTATLSPSIKWSALATETGKAAQKLRAFNHPLRTQLLVRLNDAGQQTVTQLFTYFHLEQSVCSQHLAILRRAGLVSIRRDGKNILYSLNHDALHILFQSCVVLNKN